MYDVTLNAIGVASYRALGHVPPRLTTIFFQCTLTYRPMQATKSDSDYIMLTVTSCEHPVTVVPLLRPNSGDASA